MVLDHLSDNMKDRLLFDVIDHPPDNMKDRILFDIMGHLSDNMKDIVFCLMLWVTLQTI